MIDIAELAVGDRIELAGGQRCTVEGTSRYAPGRTSRGVRLPGVTIRLDSGGRARTVGQDYLFGARRVHEGEARCACGAPVDEKGCVVDCGAEREA